MQEFINQKINPFLKNNYYEKLFTTLTLVFAISAFAMAQSNSTTSEATKATTTVNAADHSQSTNAADCTPEK